MADITLNAAMRANLLSLQNTTQLQATTQGRLATGKKVNSALDNPTEFFAAAALNNRASDLSNLLDGMGQAIQTITQASGGITSAESLIGQMQSVANDAITALNTANSTSATSALVMTATAGTVTTAVTATDTSFDLRTMVKSTDASLGIASGATLTVKVDTGATYTFTVGGSNAGNTYAQSNGGGSTVQDLSTWLSHVDGGSASGSGNLVLSVSTGTPDVVIKSNDTNHSVTLGGTLVTTLGLSTSAMTSGSATNTGTVGVYTGSYTITMYANTSTALSDITNVSGKLIGTGGSTSNTGNYGLPGSTLILGSNTISITSGMTVQGLMTAIDGINGLQASYSNAGGLVLSNTTGSTITVGGTAAALLGYSGTVGSTLATSSVTTGVTLYQGIRSGGGTGTSALATYTAQYDTLRTQLNQLVQDSSYQGVNLIAGTSANPLTVTFNSDATNPNKLVINAVDLTTSGLGVDAASSSWSDANSINSSLSELTGANNTLRAQATSFGQNLTTVETRQDFTTNMINTLQTGAGDLVNADMNTESANMLALQTQQQLGISSLSLASQAAQSILKLFP